MKLTKKQISSSASNLNQNTNTPQTDSEAFHQEWDCRRFAKDGPCVDTNFARQLETAKKENWQEVLDWERWAKEMCEDFRIPFDNHKVGLRMAITQWMAERAESQLT